MYSISLSAGYRPAILGSRLSKCSCGAEVCCHRQTTSKTPRSEGDKRCGRIRKQAGAIGHAGEWDG